eukprot:1160651-Pelagomonas_calceolata.AAC.1
MSFTPEVRMWIIPITCKYILGYWCPCYNTKMTCSKFLLGRSMEGKTGKFPGRSWLEAFLQGPGMCALVFEL